LRIRENLKIYPDSTDIKLEFSIEEIDNRSVRLHVGVIGKIEGYLFQDNHNSLMQTSNAVCPACTRKAGSYFESIVQLRSAGRKLNASEIKEVRDTLDEMLHEMEPDPMFFITSEGPVTGGWDMQLGSKAMARSWGKRLTQKFGGTIKETSTVVGANDGIEVTRLTLSYRKPAYSIGDVIKLKGDLWLISRWQKDGPVLRRMKF
jgi:nonsense-mediated mRNA decay protein 3